MQHLHGGAFDEAHFQQAAFQLGLVHATRVPGNVNAAHHAALALAQTTQPHGFSSVTGPVPVLARTMTRHKAVENHLQICRMAGVAAKPLK
jgi:limonene-1,2-epoxide hydrolase